MESTPQKSLKITTSEQFQVLVKQLEESPELARSTPVFGASRAMMDEKWQEIALKINALGPPQRTVTEWKKIWADLKNRTKKKIAEQHKNLRSTGGGPFVFCALTEMEKTIERILSLSTAAAPNGQFFGIGESAEIQLPQSPALIPLSGETVENSHKSPLPPAPEITGNSPQLVHTPRRPGTRVNLKRKCSVLEEQLKLCKAQIKVQDNTLAELREQNKILLVQAEALKIQADVTRDIAASMKQQAEATAKISEAIAEIANHIKNH